MTKEKIAKSHFRPFKYEIRAIAGLLAKRWGLEGEEIVDLVSELYESDRVRVFRDYISDGPGFIGDIFCIVFGGGPEFNIVVGCYKGEGVKSHFPQNWEVYESEFPRR